MRIFSLCTVIFLLACGVVSAQNLQDVTTGFGNNLTTNPIRVQGTGALFALKGNDSRYIHWVNATDVEKAWIGYGTAGSNSFGIANRLGDIIMYSSLLDIRSRAMVNNAVDDGTSALIVNGNVRLSSRGKII